MDNNFIFLENVAYGNHERHILDIYIPKNGVDSDLLIYENSGHTLDKDPEATEKAREIIREYAVKYF